MVPVSRSVRSEDERGDASASPTCVGRSARSATRLATSSTRATRARCTRSSTIRGAKATPIPIEVSDRKRGAGTLHPIGPSV
eukprot:scaffold7602_cov123-Isochrysis_galbana.AAC.2